MSQTLLLATNNSHKVKEIRTILAAVPFVLLSLSDFSDVPELVENGETLEENALIKAREVFKYLKMPVVSDDTGLEVSSLGGQPGVYSARYAGAQATYAENRQKLLQEMRGMELGGRKARFRCAVVYLDSITEKMFEGSCEGRIVEEEHGSGGFGYDPIFVPDGYSQTFGEIPSEVKNRISHRAKAFSSVREFLLKRLTD